MSKSISVIYHGVDPKKMNDLVESGLRFARRPEQIQFVFFVESSNKEAKEAVHRLYSKHPPDLFIKDYKETIKVVCKEDFDLWVFDCRRKCDASVVFQIKNGTEGVFYKDWDDQYLLWAADKKINHFVVDA